MSKLADVIQDIPQQSQVQFDTQSQLKILTIVANRLGLYDATDVLKGLTNPQNRSPLPKPRSVYY